MSKKVASVTILLSMLISIISPVMAWELERPSGPIKPDQRTESAFTDGKAAVGLGVHAAEYHENSIDYPAYGNDYLKLRISATANTRKMIAYDVVQVDEILYSWHDNLPFTLTLGDDSGARIPVTEYSYLPRFYGGPNSCEYEDIWVTSNGVVSFDPHTTFTDPYCNYDIPNEGGPNAFIAPLWKDLNPQQGGSITYGSVIHRFSWYTSYGLCISWNNISDKYSGALQTFQILIECERVGGSGLRQSDIVFQYKSITLDDPRTVIGIEDQQGGKGLKVNNADIGNGKAVAFYQSSHSGLIATLAIRMSANDPYSHTAIENDPGVTRGYNVILDQDVPDESLMYKLALSGTKSLLGFAGTTVIGETVLAGGVVAGTTFISLGSGILIGIGLTALEYFAQQQKKATLYSTNGSTYATVHARDYNDIGGGFFSSSAVDASLDILVYWIFTEPETQRQNHSLTVTAELTYYEFDESGPAVATPTIQTSVTLDTNTDDNNSPGSAPTIIPGILDRLFLGGYDQADYYKFSASIQHRITIEARFNSTDTTIPRLLLDLTLYDPSGIPRSWTTGYSDYAVLTHVADIGGQWYVRVCPESDRYGFYSLTFSLQPNGAPNDPTLSGSQDVFRNVVQTYTTNAVTDPDGDQIRYHMNATSLGAPYQDTTALVDSGTPMSWNLVWDYPGSYLIQVWVEDAWGALSQMTSFPVTVINISPNQPSTPSGNSSGYVYTSYSYSTSSTDPEGDHVKYTYTWGDGKSNVTDWCAQGQTISESHSWEKPGTYSINVCSQDPFGAQSVWSPTRSVSIAQNDAGLGVDAGNNFTDATLIVPSSNCHNGTLYASDPYDHEDWYVFHVTPGQHVYISFIPPPTQYPYIELYDDTPYWPVWKDFSPQLGEIEVISHEAESTDCWIRIYSECDQLYQFRLALQNDADTGGDAGNTLANAALIYETPFYRNGTLYNPYPAGDTEDWYKFYVTSGYQIYLSMEPSADADFHLELYDPNGSIRQVVHNGGIGQRDWFDCPADLSGNWNIRIFINSSQDGEGLYWFYLSILTGEEGGDSCPMLFVWNATQYVNYGVIDIHDPSGQDVLREVPLEAGDVYVADYMANLVLREGWPTLNISESVIDRVRLYAIDLQGNRHLCPLVSATHSGIGCTLLQLLFSDNRKVDLSLLETIDLTFIVPYPPQYIASYVFAIEGCNQLKQ